MIDTDAYKNLMQALDRVLSSFPASLTESGQDKGKKSDRDIPDPSEHKIAIVSVGKMDKDGSKIPKLSAKPDKKNSGPVGSGKKGNKGE